LEGEVSLGLNPLGLNDEVAVSGAWTPPTQHKSAGLAFLLSFFLPGVGQLYCGKIGRGVTTLGFWIVAAVVRLTGDPSGLGLIVGFVLWVFAFLDAYFTAVEINSGIDDQIDYQNPRVAATLNLLTAGIGYFYLGERAKGIALFIVINALKFGIGSTAGYLRGAVSLLTMTVGIVMAIDAWRTARERVKAAIASPAQPVPVGAKSSRLPAFVPMGLAGLACAVFVGMIVIGTAVLAVRGTGRRVSRALLPNGTRRHSPTALDQAVGDLLSTVRDIQNVEQKTDHDPEDISSLQQDVARLNTVLGDGNMTSADAPIAYFYRGQALRMLNVVREQQGDDIDTSSALGALQDFERVIAEDASGYLREVTPANAEFLAGLVARDYLHQERKAYSYWEKCAGLSQAGCLHIMATAHVTGAGGAKVDVAQALQLNSFVYSMGVRADCTGPQAARSIAHIIHFVGGRRPGDDELVWTKRAYGLMEQFEGVRRSSNACGRAHAEIDEFLFRLERGERHPEILQDADKRVGFTSKSTQALIDYFSGRSDDKAFEAAVQASKPAESGCGAYFDAMWFAQIKGKRAVAQRYYDRLKSIDKPSCRPALVYARKFNLGP
jgi:TM2 domain-containing membrane protein YozV